MGLGILCPGQGSQGPGMLDLLDGEPTAQRALDQAGLALGRDLRELVRNGTDLYRNRVAQPLLCAVQAATWAALAPQLPAPRVFAGYSVGELAAYGCAGALPVSQLASLARHRALLMDAASVAPSGLVAVRGLGRPRVEALCHRFGTEIAIVVGIDRFVIGGASDSLTALREAVSSTGAVLSPLPVDVAAHTSVLAPAGSAFRQELAASAITAPTVPVLAGVDGMPVHTRDGAIEALSRQIHTTIDWATCLQTLTELGCTALLELGPGSALARLARDALPHLPARSVADFRSLGGVAAWVASSLF